MHANYQMILSYYFFTVLVSLSFFCVRYSDFGKRVQYSINVVVFFLFQNSIRYCFPTGNILRCNHLTALSVIPTKTEELCIGMLQDNAMRTAILSII